MRFNGYDNRVVLLNDDISRRSDLQYGCRFGGQNRNRPRAGSRVECDAATSNNTEVRIRSSSGNREADRQCVGLISRAGRRVDQIAAGILKRRISGGLYPNLRRILVNNRDCVAVIICIDGGDRSGIDQLQDDRLVQFLSEVVVD